MSGIMREPAQRLFIGEPKVELGARIVAWGADGSKRKDAATASFFARKKANRANIVLIPAPSFPTMRTGSCGPRCSVIASCNKHAVSTKNHPNGTKLGGLYELCERKRASLSCFIFVS